MLCFLPITLPQPIPLGNLTFVKHTLTQIVTGRSVPAFHDGGHNPSSASPVGHIPTTCALALVTSNSLPSLDNVIFTKETTAPPQTGPARLQGAAWVAGGLLATGLILLIVLLAGLTSGVMSVDMTRLRVWTRTGNLERR